MRIPATLTCLASLALASYVSAQSSEGEASQENPPKEEERAAPLAYSETVEVTATRVPTDVDDVPVSIQVISGEDLRERGATDLKSALALVSGVDIAPGGDGGPAASVPEFWGLREFDAFLLVVDGVPWGGAFNPALSTLDLTDVERIEVQRGPAPVLYGATSFVGVIQVVRRPPGEGGARVSASIGSYESGHAFASAGLPRWAGFDSTLNAGFERDGFRDERASVKRGHVLWRNRRSSEKSVFHFDVDATFLRQQPASPSPRTGQSLSPLVPIDANHNPEGAFLNEDRYFLNLGYDRALSWGLWNTTVSFTHAGQDQLRGFLNDVSADVPNATGFRAQIDQNDLYLDSHVAWTTRARLRAVAGVDYLFGKAEAEGDVFDYGIGLDGSGPPGSIPVGDTRGIDDLRGFLGIYGRVEWSPSPPWRFVAGLRLNRTEEEREEGQEVAPRPGEDERVENTRPAGELGVTWTAWEQGSDHLALFANWKNAFKPAAIDFNLAEEEGGEGEAGILKPETSNSFEAGVKTELLDHHLRIELSAFRMDLANLVVARSVGGLPALANAGSTRLQGAELAAVWSAPHHLVARGAYSYHDARFRDYLTEFDGVPTQLSGNRLEMSPHNLGSVALSYAPEVGVFASTEMSLVGSRFLDKRNRALADAYATLGAMVGYRQGRWELRLTGTNLTSRRDPVSESELGDAQYYRLFPRRLDVATTVSF